MLAASAPEPTEMDRPDIQCIFVCENKMCSPLSPLLQFLDCVCRIGTNLIVVPIICISKSTINSQHKKNSTKHKTMERHDMEPLISDIGHRSIPRVLIAALILLIVLIVLPNVFLAPTNPKDKAD